jgi:tetratricopeptide (TPR) repeat protein
MRRFIFGVAVLAVVLAAAASRASAQQPTSADAQQLDDLLSRALIAHKAGDLVGAVQNYQVALQIAPDRADVRSNLGAALIGLGRFPEGIEEYRKALATADDPQIRLNFALALYKGAKPQDAVPEFQRVLQQDPTSKQATLLLADCLLQLERDRDVMDLLSPREADFPDDLAYAYLLGTALLRQGETEKGQVLIDRIFKRGESAEGHLLMGLAHLNRRDFQSAVPEFAKAVELNPELPTVQALYGRALLGSGDREKAMRAYRKALEQDPDNFDANLQLGTLYRLDQKYDLALTYLKRAQGIRPDDLGLRHAMAAALLGVNDVDKARELLEGVVKEAPSFVDGHVLLATTYYRLKRKEDGDRERAVVAQLTAENQAKQPGARKAQEVDDATPATATPTPVPPSPQD